MIPTTVAAEEIREVFSDDVIQMTADFVSIIRRDEYGYIKLSSVLWYDPKDRWYATTEHDGTWVFKRPGKAHENITFPDFKQMLIYIRLLEAANQESRT